MSEQYDGPQMTQRILRLEAQLAEARLCMKTFDDGAVADKAEIERLKAELRDEGCIHSWNRLNVYREEIDRLKKRIEELEKANG